VVATGLLKTPRLLRLLRVARRIDRYSEYGASVLLLLMAAFTLFAHWLACAFYALAYYELHESDSAAVGYLNYLANLTGMEYNFNDTASGPDIRSCYITSLYFTFTILTSVGFGNVAPVTNYEKVFTIFAMMVGCEYRSPIVP
jgi:potassium voltage-gated channel Eag-related subfamily H member 2